MDGLNEGRIVHYVAYNLRSLAAIVIGGDFQSGVLNLAVFTDMPNAAGVRNFGLQFHQDVAYAEEPTPGTWHWRFPGQATQRWQPVKEHETIKDGE